jgi:hypothetical protein
MNKKVLILGNGFDLDLGLPTSYRHFVESMECGILSSDHDNYLTKRLVNNYRLNGWIDVEEELKKFAKENNGKSGPDIYKFESEFIELVSQLRKYLLRVTEMPDRINIYSISALLLKVVETYPYDFEIFSFNYTNLNRIKKALNLNKSLRYTHVHGSLDDNTLILGFEDDTESVDDYSFMIKTFNPNYSSHHLRHSLSQADEVIFFGHSLGSTDYHYFSQFFKEKSKAELKREDSVRISFITANNQSHISILNQLRKMNNRNTNLLFDQNDIEFYYTSDYRTRSRIFHFIERLQLECKANRIITNSDAFRGMK